MKHILSVGYDAEDLRECAQDLADQLHLVLDNDVLPRLCVAQDKLGAVDNSSLKGRRPATCLRDPIRYTLVLLVEHFSPLCVDFNSVIWQKRRDAGKKQGLVRACQPAKGVRILDVTAGWGRDAAVLASFGAQVLMIERQPIMAALLADGLRRVTGSMSLSLLHADAKHYLQTLAPTDYPDVIYIDPMHPSRQKSALVKKDMQVLQQLIGTDNDALELIQLAITRARQRVVVKWPQRLPALLPPNSSVPGKTVRFDIYR